MMTMLGPGFRPMSVYYHVTFDQLTTFMIGIVILCTGMTTFFTAAAASVWGKRPVFIYSVVLLAICCLWGWQAKSFVSLAVMRAFSGIAAAPLETLVTSAISDMFFVHERGRKLAIWGLMMLSGMHVNSLIFSIIIDKTGPLVFMPFKKKEGRHRPAGAKKPTGFTIKNGVPGIQQHMGIKMAFFLCMMIWLVVIVLLYFFVPEMEYERKKKSPSQQSSQVDLTDTASESNEPKRVLTDAEKDNDTLNNKKEGTTVLETSATKASVVPEEKMSRKEELRIYRGRITHRSYWKCVVQPLPLVFFPAVVFSTLVYGIFMAWLVILHAVQFNILSKEPYYFGPLQLGIIGLPAMLGALVFMPLSGYTADWLIRFLSKRNKGIYEPEFRLWLMIPACVISSISFIGFGWAVANKKSPTIIVLFSTLQSCAVPWAKASAFLYVIDCHSENSNEAFVIINLFKAIVVFLASLKVSYSLYPYTVMYHLSLGSFMVK
jgi:MFS family permease